MHRGYITILPSPWDPPQCPSPGSTALSHLAGVLLVQRLQAEAQGSLRAVDVPYTVLPSLGVLVHVFIHQTFPWRIPRSAVSRQLVYHEPGDPGRQEMGEKRDLRFCGKALQSQCPRQLSLSLGTVPQLLAHQSTGCPESPKQLRASAGTHSSAASSSELGAAMRPQ